MNKIRIYLDTSIISYLDQKDVPEKMKETQKVWSLLKSNEYQVIISNLVFREISEATEEKRKKLMSFVEEIDYEKCEINEDILNLADLIINEGILKPKSMDDAIHIAAAIYSNSDIILSWNFKHLVNYNTINGVRQICFRNNINKIVDICSPYVLLENEKKGEWSLWKKK